MKKTLRGDRNQCPTCGEYFNSTMAFYKHRVGRYDPNERHARGEKNGHSVLTDEQVLVIRADGRTLEQVAADYGISASHVCAIQRGTFWRHLPGARAAKIPRLGEGDIAQIKARHTGKYGCGAALAREFGVSQSYISWIVRHG